MQMKFQIEKYHFKTESIFEQLPLPISKKIKEVTVRKEEKKGSLIFREGTFSKGLYIVKKGTVKIFQINNEGKEQIVYIYKKGEMMGYRPILCNEKHPVGAAALEDCVIHMIPANQFMQVLNESPIMARKLLEHLSHEFTVWVNKISVFGQQPVLVRVAMALLILNEKYKKEKQSGPVVINLSREDIANYVGTTIESLVRMFRFLKDKNIITTHGRKISILQPGELLKVVNLH